MNRFLLLTTLAILGLGGGAYGQKVALKGNLLYGGVAQTPNLGLELGLGKKTTMELAGGYNPWNLDGSSTNNKKLVHWMAQMEFRLWTCQRFNGPFWGLHGLYSRYNISGHKLPRLFGKNSDDYRFEGDAYGFGMSYGYQWILGKRWNLEATIGAGMVFLNYDQYDCEKCGNKLKEETRTYLGPTRAGISLIYFIK